jgi:hypothetical protein
MVATGESTYDSETRTKSPRRRGRVAGFLSAGDCGEAPDMTLRGKSATEWQERNTFHRPTADAAKSRKQRRPRPFSARELNRMDTRYQTLPLRTL